MFYLLVYLSGFLWSCISRVKAVLKRQKLNFLPIYWWYIFFCNFSIQYSLWLKWFSFFFLTWFYSCKEKNSIILFVDWCLIFFSELQINIVFHVISCFFAGLPEIVTINKPTISQNFIITHLHKLFSPNKSNTCYFYF